MDIQTSDSSPKENKIGIGTRRCISHAHNKTKVYTLARYSIRIERGKIKIHTVSSVCASPGMTIDLEPKVTSLPTSNKSKRPDKPPSPVPGQ